MRRFLGRRALALAAVPLILALLGVAQFRNAPVAAASAAPTVTVSGFPGPGDDLVIGGGDWPYGDPITLTYDGTPLATTRVSLLRSVAGSAAGAFSATVQVPLTTTTGAHIIAATDTQTSVTAQTTITVQAEWKQFGFTSAGARYNPYETAISAANANKLTLAWTFNTGYSGYVAPTVSRGALVISNGAAHEMYALNPTTGAQLWSHNPGGGYEQVAADYGTIYSSLSNLFALSLSTSAELWESSGSYGVTGDPILANGLVYVENTVNNTPVIQAYPAAGCGQAICDPLWSYATPGGYPGTPAIANGSIYLGGSELSVLDAATGATQWTAAITSGETVTTVVVDNGYVFFTGYSPYTGGTLYVFNAAGCGQATCTPLWTDHTASGWGYSPAAANGVIYVGGRDHTLDAFAEAGCGQATCTPQWKGAVPSQELAAPAVANGVVYALAWATGVALAFDTAGCNIAYCSPLWSYTMPSSPHYVDAPPTVANGMLYVSDDSGTLYAFHLPATASRSGASPASPATAAASSPPRGTSQPPQSRWPYRQPWYQEGWPYRPPLI